MEVIKRNTDYAFRLMATLATDCDKNIPVRRLASESVVPYQLACKILQKLSSALLVESKMGPKGGYKLADLPEKINLKQIIEAVQGTIIFNQCLRCDSSCPLSSACTISGYLAEIQLKMNEHFESKTLAMLISSV